MRFYSLQTIIPHLYCFLDRLWKRVGEKAMGKMNKSQFAILSLLSKRALSGYDIKQMASHISPFQWAESNAQIYPILKKLAEEKMVESKIDEKSGDRNRRLYSITHKGLEYLKTWLKYPVEPALYREELLLKLSAGEHVSITMLTKHLESYYQHLSDQYNELTAIQQHIEKEHKEGLRKLYITMIYDHMKLVFDAKLSWCEQGLGKLRAVLEQPPLN